MSSVVDVSHNALQRSETPNWAYTDNPVYWNKYEIAALEQLSTCLNCSDKFIPEVAGQSFCSEECYIPPCSICHDELAFLDGDQPKTIGMPLCACCYWETIAISNADESDDLEEVDYDDYHSEEEVDEPSPKPSDFAPGKIYIEGSNNSDYFYSRVKVMPDGTLLEINCNIHQDVETIRVFSTWEEWQDYCSPSRY